MTYCNDYVDDSMYTEKAEKEIEKACRWYVKFERRTRAALPPGYGLVVIRNGHKGMPYYRYWMVPVGRLVGNVSVDRDKVTEINYLSALDRWIEDRDKVPSNWIVLK